MTTFSATNTANPEALRLGYAALAVLRSHTPRAKSLPPTGYVSRDLYVGFNSNEERSTCVPTHPGTPKGLTASITAWCGTAQVLRLEWDWTGRYEVCNFKPGAWQEQLLRAADALTAPSGKPANDNAKSEAGNV